MSAKDDLELARWLFSGGAGRSAVALLDRRGVRGAEANSLRLRGAASRLVPGIYGLVVYQGAGLVVPIRPRFGRTEGADDLYAHSCGAALGVASACLGCELPGCSFEIEEVLGIEGDSLGLALLLALVGHFSERSPRRPVVATGALLEDGTIGPVDHLDLKLAAARRELEGLDDGGAMVLRPASDGHRRSARTLVTEVFGEGVAVSPRMLRFDEALARAESQADHETAARQLRKLLEREAAPADRARGLLALGVRLRHLGLSDEAERIHEEAENLARDGKIARVLGASAAEYFRIQAFATMRDAYRLDEAEAGLRALLPVIFDTRNLVHCRGTLAQVLAMKGRPGEAVEMRAGNVELQEGDEALRADLPQTYCNLAYDSARSGDGAGFERWARYLLGAQSDSAQSGYDAASWIRGLVRLGRFREAVAWADGAELLGKRCPGSIQKQLRGSQSLGGHPMVSTVRALLRAHRREGALERAMGLGARVPRGLASGPSLVDWLYEVTHLERALALEASARADEASHLIGEVRARLPTLHEGATRHHKGLMSASGQELEAAIDEVWY